MNNKGFTLVELLAVMIILITISLVSVSAITESLARREVKECMEQQELAVGAAKIYFSMYNTDSVTISQLKNINYIKNDSKISKLKLTDVVSLNNDDYLYNGGDIGSSCN